ncbi:MAG TPA: 4Fe-4S dicluster domain-containing protein, partial [Desulfobacteraceae bacterium]|nr:4Fe-4S dicluster domain-containing protein [Desulfobacteraceae bacterium]
RASEYVKSPDGGIAVIIARHPCVIAYRDKAIPKRKKIKITDRCVECNLCIERFECPALYRDEELGRTAVDPVLCTGCGVCIEVCPKGAIVEE